MMKPPVAGLYVVTAASRARSLEQSVAEAIAGGARVVQYRDKSSDAARRKLEAKALAALCREHGVAFIINDDIELAARVEADGVHVGQHDAAVAEARAALGEAAIVGASCYDDLDRAERALAAGADYLAFGSVYPSVTKPESKIAPLSIFAEARALTDKPLVAIGGINAGNIASVTAAGADCVAVIDAVFAADDIRAAAAELVRNGFAGQSDQEQ